MALVISIGGVRRSQPTPVNINDELNDAPNSLTFSIGEEGGGEPALYSEVTVYKDGTQIFGGLVVATEQIYEGQITQLAWKVTAADYGFELNRRRPFGCFVDVPIRTIVQMLVTQFAPSFTINGVATNLPPATITLDGSQDFTSAMTAIAQLGGAVWYPGYDKDIVMYIPT